MNCEFKLSLENPYLAKAYEGENYKEIVVNEEIKTCYLFFSGNGIYYPNSKETFDNVIFQNDRYEWEHIAATLMDMNKVGKLIFFRDIFKTWYLKGINKDVNDINKLILLCKKLTEDYQIFTCGNSAGGYIATIIGMKLGAEAIYNFSGQWSILADFKNGIPEEYYYLWKEQNNDNYNKWFEIKNLQDNSCPIFWFYSNYVKTDIIQKDYLVDSPSSKVYSFAVDSKYHGYTILPECYKAVFSLNINRLIYFSLKYKGMAVRPIKIAYDMLDFQQFTICFLNDMIRRHKSLQILKRVFMYDK